MVPPDDAPATGAMNDQGLPRSHCVQALSTAGGMRWPNGQGAAADALACACIRLHAYETGHSADAMPGAS
jgi:hypothetical protein